MGRFTNCLTLTAAVCFSATSSIVHAENTGVCGEQAKCLTVVARGCTDGKRKVCMRWMPQEGCSKTARLPYTFPDICTVTDENSQTGVGTYPWRGGWARRVCQEISPATPTIFAIRDHTDCTGEAAVTQKYSNGKLSAVGNCSPATTEMCDLQPYKHWFFSTFAPFWEESQSWTKTANRWSDTYYFDLTDRSFRPSLPKACRWEVNALPCPGNLGSVSCCQSDEASCKACQAGFTVENYCKAFPDSNGCKATEVCCEAVEASCEACKLDIDVDEYCLLFPDTDGCGNKEVCCQALEASCEACKLGIDVGEYCSIFPDMDGCQPQIVQP